MFQSLARVILMLAIGAAGGGLFYVLNLPLPWMMGAMTATIIAAISPLPVSSPRPVRPVFAAILGIALGSTFSYEIVSTVDRWGIVFIAMILFSIVAMVMNMVYLTRVAKYDSVTAYFSSIPGGIYDLTAAGEAAGGDARKIALTHSTRIFLLVLLVPLLFRFSYGISGGTVAPVSVWRTDWWIDWALLIGSAVVGWPLAALLRLPNPPLLGSLLGSAAIHIFGFTAAAPPGPIVAMAQVVLGTTIGAQFIGAPRALLGKAMLHGLVLFLPVMAVCALIAWPTVGLSHVDFPVIILALAPGGMSEMSLVALAMHAEVAIVSANQALRMLVTQTAGPAAYNWWDRRRKKKAGGG